MEVNTSSTVDATNIYDYINKVPLKKNINVFSKKKY